MPILQWELPVGMRLLVMMVGGLALWARAWICLMTTLLGSPMGLSTRLRSWAVGVGLLGLDRWACAN